MSMTWVLRFASYKKIIKVVNIYNSPKEMIEKEEIDKIFPEIGSKENLLKFYEEAKIKWGKKYKSDIEKFGIVAIGTG